MAVVHDITLHLTPEQLELIIHGLECISSDYPDEVTAYQAKHLADKKLKPLMVLINDPNW